MTDPLQIAEVAEDGEYVTIRVNKNDLGNLSELSSDKENPIDIMSFWGKHKDYCAVCKDGTRKPITAKNCIEAAIVGIAKCGGPCSVSRGGCN